MTMNHTWRLAAWLAASTLGFVMVGAQGPGPTRTVLQQGDLSVPGRGAVMVRATFPAGSSTGRHTHPGEEMSYVLEGTLRLEVDGEPVRTLKAGDVLMIPAGKVHNATNGGQSTLSVLATYVVEKGKALATPAI